MILIFDDGLEAFSIKRGIARARFIEVFTVIGVTQGHSGKYILIGSWNSEVLASLAQFVS